MKKIRPSNIALICTCESCPEQYDAFAGKEQVGYLRLRHGVFDVRVPDTNGETVLIAYPQGDGRFIDEDERSTYLFIAKKKITEAWNSRRSE